MSARQQLAPALYNLASCYYNGEGVKKDKVFAMALYCRALLLGDERAKAVVSQLMGELSEDEQAKAVDMANKLFE